MRTHVGSVQLANPICTASGTSGHGTELGRYMDLSSLGAVVVKSLCEGPWPGNRPPRLMPAGEGMLNSVGLQGPGVRAWMDVDLPKLEAAGAKVVASIWGRSVDGFAAAASAIAAASAAVVAVEVNVSCPNVEDRSRMFSHSPQATSDAVEASKACGRPLWAKLSPNVANLAEIAAAAVAAGAEALVLVNTLLGMALDTSARRPALGGAGGGLSGPPLHPVAVRAVWDCREALPEVPIVGVGGVRRGVDAVELMMAGASAVEVGTASFAEPSACIRVLGELDRWCTANGVTDVAELVSVAHG